MATPIVHLVIASRLALRNIIGDSIAEFTIGTSFPDIRKLVNFDRKITHPDNIGLANLTGASAFHAGLIIHNLLDTVREDIVVNSGIYDLVDSKYPVETIKFIEDQIAYQFVVNWQEIHNYFNNLFDEELLYPLIRQDVLSWHRILQSYVIASPNTSTRKAFLAAIGQTPNTIALINTDVERYYKNDSIRDIASTNIQQTTSELARLLASAAKQPKQI